MGRPIHNTKWLRIVYSEQTRSCWKHCEDQIGLLRSYTPCRNTYGTKKAIIPHDEGLENLLVLLGDNNYLVTSSHASVLDLPTNADLSKFLDHVTEHPQ